jgi:energy-coupling factor transporter transmembrane protein EcfT
LPLALLCGALSAAFSHFAGLQRWWIIIQFLFIPALILVRQFNLPPAFFLAAFIILLIVYWSTFKTQVPLYLSSRKIWGVLELLLPLEVPGNRFTFMDLGCGIGGVLTHLSKARPDGNYSGVEAAPFPYMVSWLRVKLGGYKNCAIRWGNLWDSDLAQYDVVFAYLSPVPMDELWAKARREMRPGTLFISNTFNVPGHPPQQTYKVDDLHHSTLYIWQM